MRATTFAIARLTRNLYPLTCQMYQHNNADMLTYQKFRCYYAGCIGWTCNLNPLICQAIGNFTFAEMPAASAEHVIHIRWYAGSIGSCTAGSPSLPLVLKIRLIKSWKFILSTNKKNKIIPHQNNLDWLEKCLKNICRRVSEFFWHTAPASPQAYSVPRSMRRRSQKAQQSCSLKLVG